jgi:hypothetical protein
MTTIPWNDLLNSSDEGGASGSYDALPADEYDVVVTDAQAKMSSTGKNMIVVRYRVESGPYKGRSLFNNFVIVPDNANAKTIFFRHMNAMGLNRAYFAQNPTLEQAADALNERECRVKVSVRQYAGQDRNQVDVVLPSSNPSSSPSGSTGLAAPTFSGEPPF